MGNDRNRRTGWHRDETHCGHDLRDDSYTEYPSIRNHRSSHLGRYRIQNSRHCIQKPEYRDSLAPRRSNQDIISNRPNHRFLAKSKHLKQYLLTSLKLHIEKIEEWLPDNESGGDDDDSEDGSSHGIESNDEMDWQLEREIVVKGYVWSSEILPGDRGDWKLDVTTHEEPRSSGIISEKAGLTGLKGMQLRDRRSDVGMAKSETDGHERLSQLSF